MNPLTLDDIVDRSHPEPNTGCWLWTGALRGRKGRLYGQVGRCTLAHRAAYAAAVGPILAGLFVCHKCDTPACVNPDHLFLGTNQDNMRDAARKGRLWAQVPGAANGLNARLTPEQVAEIRSDMRPRVPGRVRDLARRFGVSEGAIYCVRRGVNYSYLPGGGRVL